MTNLATCSYAEFRPEMGIPVRISLGRPRWWSGTLAVGALVTEITPRGWYLRRPEPEYVEAYGEQLARYGVEVIQTQFDAIDAEHGEPLVLLCFETLAWLGSPEPIENGTLLGRRCEGERHSAGTTL